MLRVPPSPPRSGFIEPCLPSAADQPPSGPDWVHEIKHDGDELRLKDRRIEELRREIDEARDLIKRMEEQIDDAEAAIERWIEAFGMEKDANDAWTWAPFAEDAIPKTVNRLLKTGRDLRKEAKGLK
jgi:chromosome segregation ATPase